MGENENIKNEESPVITEEMLEEGAIELHPEEAKHRQDTYSSLTDLSGIDVFSDNFQEIVNQVQEKKSRKFKAMQNEIFTEEVIREQDADAEISSFLFTGQKEQTLLHDYEKSSNGWSVMDISLVLIAILAVSALYIFFFNDRKVRRKRI